jgi:L-ascorbate metabolism protein UlaG (beta-lactamase superfamily)
MAGMELKLSYIGGPTALIEVGGVRLLTDPTFDPGGTDYPTPVYTLRKTAGPAIGPESLGRIDAVLLSHDHHFDNLDHAGRSLLNGAGKVLTTQAGAERLGGNSVGLTPWQSIDLPTSLGGGALRITATPARHGPPEGDRGPVIGFVLAFAESPKDAVYVSGDTVWYDGVAEVGRRFSVRVAILFMGAARVAAAGPSHLTFTADEGVEAARAFPNARIVPVHYEGWEHFSESRSDIQKAFASAGIDERLLWLEPGRSTSLGS